MSKAARNKKVRSPRVRRERRPKDAAVVEDTSKEWIVRVANKMEAMKILNNHPERPYWASLPWEPSDGNPPVAGVLPCSWFRTKRRVYYGFLFRHHREWFLSQQEDARSEFLERVLAIPVTSRI